MQLPLKANQTVQIFLCHLFMTQNLFILSQHLQKKPGLREQNNYFLSLNKSLSKMSSLQLES